MSGTAVLALAITLVPTSAQAACTTDTSTPGTTVVTCSGTISTTGFSSPAAAASSTGGIGSINASGGVGGNGDIINFISSASLETSGSGSAGILATSNGGGGAINGSGTGGHGGAVTVNSSGSIGTSADDSHGINAVSGGGTGGINGNGNGGLGDVVTVTSSGVIMTSGQQSNGIYAVSSGGYGGINGSGTGGNGGTITVTSSGVISTSGDMSHGIYASSTGGVGSINGNGTGGNGGEVTVNSSKNVTVSGDGAIGIWASSQGGTGAINGSGPNGSGSDVTVNITGGTVAGGTVSGYGVRIEAGAGVGTTATLNNHGTVSALSGNAIYASGANAYVGNHGTVIGNVELSGPNSNFDNRETGLFESGSTVSAYVYNLGTLSPGGSGAVQSTAISGNYQQNSTGKYKVDADWTGNSGAGLSDSLTVGGTAVLAGTVIVNPLNFPSSAIAANTGLNKTFTILTAAGGVTDNGLTVTDTAAVDYSLLYPDLNTVNLKAVIDFTPDPVDPRNPGLGTGGLTPNQTKVGETLNMIVKGGDTLGFVPALLTVPTTGGLANALDQLAPTGDGGSNSSALSTGNTFGGQLLSCKTTGEKGDAEAIIREGQCLWARASVRTLDNSGGKSGVGFDETATFYSAGTQFDVGGPWRAGGGFGFETSNLQSASNAKSEGDRLHLGAVLKYNPGPWLMAASVTGGHGWFDNERHVSFGGFSQTATSDTDTSFVAGRFTGAYLASFAGWYAKPQVDVAITHLERDGYTESAAGGIALAVKGSSDDVVSVSPSLEIGTQGHLESGAIVRPYVKAGVTWLDTDTFTTTAGFADAPAGIAPFSIATQIDDVVADVGAGVDFIAPAGIVLRLQYDGRFGDLTTQHGGTAKLSVPF